MHYQTYDHRNGLLLCKQDPNYNDTRVWRLDFARESMSVEVSFNHGEALAWNLLKPVLASAN
jgi:hypothetical protein